MASICVPENVPQANRDAMELHRAFEGVGCNSVGVIHILAHRDCPHRLKIRQVYQNMFIEDLRDRIKSEIHGHFKKAMLLWICSPAERDAIILKRALKLHAARRNKIVIEVLWTRSMEELDAISSAFESMNGRSLQTAIEAAVQNQSCRELFVRYLTSNRDDTSSEDANHFHISAKQMNYESLIHLLTTKSNQHLCSILEAYKSNNDDDILQAPKCIDNNDIEFKKTIETVIECVDNPALYFAKVLYKSMKGLGTHDDELIRVVVTRAEVDMADIKQVFFHKYKIVLESMVASDTIGNYRKFLRALIGAGY